MSNYHITTTDKYGNAHNVICHIPIPDILNDINYSYRTAVVERQGGASEISSDLVNISGTELTQLQAGELVEKSYTLHSNPNETLGQKQARMDIIYSDLVTETQEELQIALALWGHSRDVP